jgi:hypothetical protein
MSVRLPPADGVIGELTKSIYGRIYDSPNAIIAFNALYSMGIYPNALVESDILPWTNDSLEDAFARAKKHLHLESNNTHDNLIKKFIKERLVFSDGRYVWPDGMRSVLFWWNPKSRIK